MSFGGNMRCPIHALVSFEHSFSRRYIGGSRDTVREGPGLGPSMAIYPERTAADSEAVGRARFLLPSCPRERPSGHDSFGHYQLRPRR